MVCSTRRRWKADSVCMCKSKEPGFFLGGGGGGGGWGQRGGCGGKGEGVGLQWCPGRMPPPPLFRVSKEVTFLLATCKLVIDHVLIMGAGAKKARRR